MSDASPGTPGLRSSVLSRYVLWTLLDVSGWHLKDLTDLTS